MTFLAPIAGVIGAAICVPTLIVLYLLKLRRIPRRVGSTLLWASAVRDLQANVPFKWIRPTWLLFLQAAILGLLLAALARPALDGAGDAPDRIAIVIDRSASMSARDMGQGRTRFQAAIARAHDLVDSLSRGGAVEVAVVDAAARPRIRGVLDSNLDTAKDAINALTPSDQPADLDAALRLAAAALTGNDADEASSPPASRIVLISDGNVEDAELHAGGVPVTFDPIRPAETIANAGITALAARRDLADPSLVRLFVRVVGDADRAIPITVRVNGEVVGGTSITLPPGTPRAEGAATIEFRRRGGGVVEVRLGVEDLLACDDWAGLVLREPAAPRLTLVTNDPDSSWAIMDVLAELSPRPPSRILESEYDPGTIAAAADVVVFDRVTPASPPPIPSISLDAAWPAPPIARLEGPTDLPIAWERAHPLMRGVLLDGVVIDPGARLEWNPDERIVEIARGTQGPLIALIDDPANPRIVAALGPANSNWWLGVGFPIFLANAVDLLTRRLESGDSAMGLTREELRVRAGNDARVSLRGPVDLSADAVERVARFGVPERAGLYQGPESEPFVAVNLLDPLESSLAGVEEIRVGGERAPSGAGPAGPREVWPWFVLAAAGLLAIEWILSAALFRA